MGRAIVWAFHASGSMNTTYYTATSIELRQGFTAGQAIANFFLLEIGRGQNRPAHLLLRTHIPPSLQAVLAHDDVSGLCVETLDKRSAAANMLPGCPTSLVVGVRRATGEVVTEIPIELRKLRVHSFALMALCACTTASLLLMGQGWASAITAILGYTSACRATSTPGAVFMPREDEPC